MRLITIILAMALALAIGAAGNSRGQRAQLPASNCVSLESNALDFQATAGGPGDDRLWRVSAAGNAHFGGRSTDVWESVVVQYISPAGAIAYATVPVGTSRTVRGRNLKVFITDSSTGDNSGSLAIGVSPA